MTLNFYTKIKIIILNFLIFSKHIAFYRFLLKNTKKSNSQVFQDLFVIFFSEMKKNGYFIEIGGGNGVDISNTYYLEKKFNWNGIICEPNKSLEKSILKSRTASLIRTPVTEKCEKQIPFYENKDPYQSSILLSKNIKNKIFLDTICLNHLILNTRSKIEIDYISIDTEGNEFEILKNFNFTKFDVNIFTIEHNFDKAKRDRIYKLLKKNNYKRVFKNISYMDDWYIKI